MMDDADFPLHAITQRPAHMYHSWGSQNAWLRQIHGENRLYVPGDVDSQGFEDGDWVWSPPITAASMPGAADGRRQPGSRCGPGTPSASAPAPGPRQGRAGSDAGFLLNHLIDELAAAQGRRPPLGQLRPDHRSGGVVRPARVDREGPTRRGTEPPVRGAAEAARSARGRPNLAYRKGEVERDDQPSRKTEETLGLVIDLDTCVGCHACAVNCKEWNTGGYSAPLRSRPLWRGPVRRLAQPRPHLRGDAGGERARRCISRAPACIARTRRLRDRLPDRRQPQARGGRDRAGQPEDLHRLRLCAWACPYGAREMDDHDDGVMKKCTLCVDRIYNDTLPEEDRIPACVRTCPAGARGISAISTIPTVDVSRLVAERGGIDLMPEMATSRSTSTCRRVQRPLPCHGSVRRIAAPPPEGRRGFLGWLDAALDKLG
jgi:Fe-S-cluster-containing dehydrogenase component